MDRSQQDYIGTNARFINALNAALAADTNIKAEHKPSVLASLGRVISQKLHPSDGEMTTKPISAAARKEITPYEIGAIAAHYELMALKATSDNARLYNHYMSHLIRHAAYILKEFSCVEIEMATQSMIHHAFGEDASQDEAIAKRLVQRLLFTQPLQAFPMEKQISLRASLLKVLKKDDFKAPAKKVSGKITPVRKDVQAEEDEASSPLEHRPFVAKQIEMLKIFQTAFVEKPPEKKKGAEVGQNDEESVEAEPEETEEKSEEERAAEKKRLKAYRDFTYNVQLLLDKCPPACSAQLGDSGFSLAQASALFKMTPKEFDWKMQEVVNILLGHTLLLPPDFSKESTRGNYPEINAKAISRSNGFATKLNKISLAYAAHDYRVVQLLPLSQHSAAAVPEGEQKEQASAQFITVWRALERNCIRLKLENPPKPLLTGEQPNDLLMLPQEEFQAIMVSMRLYARGTAIRKNIKMFTEDTTELERHYDAYHRAIKRNSARSDEPVLPETQTATEEIPDMRVTDTELSTHLVVEGALKSEKGEGRR